MQLPFAAAHIPGAYGLSLQGLHSVGMDNVVGYLEGNMTAWAASGLKTARLESISIMELKERLDQDELILIDTRLQSEWDEMHIANSIHAPVHDVRTRYAEWMGDKPAAFICNTGSRSLLAGSLMLKYSGMKNVINVIGGTNAWVNLGFPTVRGGS